MCVCVGVCVGGGDEGGENGGGAEIAGIAGSLRALTFSPDTTSQVHYTSCPGSVAP